MAITIGRIVHYRLSEKDLVGVGCVGEYRPAIVVQTFPNYEGINLQVFLDGENDHARDIISVPFPGQGATIWATSRIEGTEPGTWRWPPREA